MTDPTVKPTTAPATTAAAPAVKAAAIPYGTEHIEQILDVIVSGADSYKAITPTDSTMQKVMRFMPVLITLATAVDGFSKAGPEFTDLDDAELEKISTKYMPKLGLGEGKNSVYVKESINIALSAFKMIRAK